MLSSQRLYMDLELLVVLYFSKYLPIPTIMIVTKLRNTVEYPIIFRVRGMLFLTKQHENISGQIQQHKRKGINRIVIIKGSVNKRV